MAVTLIGRMNFPAYTALSSDIVTVEDTDTLPSAQPGLPVYIIDTGEWKIVTPGTLALEDFYFPVSTPA